MQQLRPVTMQQYLRWTCQQEIKREAERNGFLIVDLDEPRPKPRLVSTVLQFAKDVGRSESDGGEDD